MPGTTIPTVDARMDARDWTRVVDEYLQRCFELESPPRAGELATMLGISPWTLSKHFARATGMRLIDYLRRGKLEFAATLLVNTDEPIPRVYEAAGFGSRSTFFREFNAAFDTSPERYRGRRVRPHWKNDERRFTG